MPFLAPGNPNAFQPYPPPQYGGFPGANWLLKQWGDVMQRAPWAVPPGVQPIPHQFPQVPGGGILTQPVADIYKFPPKMPGMLGATEGAGGRGLGSRGGGMLGSKWRDPGYIQQYEVQQGLKPGSLQQPSAPITTIAPQGPQRDFGKYNAKVTDPRMLTPEARPREGREPFTFTTGVNPKQLVEWPASGTSSMTAQQRAAYLRMQERAALERQAPTPAQMARPVKQTPEISAKLAEARAKRAALVDKAVERAKLPPAKDKLPSFDDWAMKHVGTNYLSRLSDSDLNRLRRAYNTFVLGEKR